MKKGHTVHVPPQSRISIRAGAVMTIPGTGDITVGAASTLVVDDGEAGGGLAIPSDDVDATGHAPAADSAVGTRHGSRRRRGRRSPWQASPTSCFPRARRAGPPTVRRLS